MPTDPTRSTTKRKRVQRRLHRKWRDMRGKVRQQLTGDSYYRPQNDVPIGRQASEFREWLESALDENVVEPVYTTRQIERGSHWTAPIVREFYEHGIKLAHQDLIDLGLDPDHPAVTVPPDAVLRRDDPRFGGEGLHHEYLTENYDEIYHDIEDAAREVSKQAYREYRDAIRTGATVQETIDRVNDRMEKVGSTRTDLVAQTKLIQVINDAILARYAELAEDSESVRVGVDPEFLTVDETGDEQAVTDGGTDTVHHTHAGTESPDGPTAAHEQHATEAEENRTQSWETANDRRVCDDCLRYENQTYTTAQIWTGAVESPPLHPLCRCRWILNALEDLLAPDGRDALDAFASDPSDETLAQLLQSGASDDEIARLLENFQGTITNPTAIRNALQNELHPFGRDSDEWYSFINELTNSIGDEDAAKLLRIGKSWLSESGHPEANDLWKWAVQETRNPNVIGYRQLKGDLDWRTKAALDRYHTLQTAKLRERHGDTVTLYRGITPSMDSRTDPVAKLGMAKITGEPVEINHRAIESWTRDPSVAANFSRGWDGGAIIQRKVPVEDILLTSRYDHLADHESEYTVLSRGSTRYNPGQIYLPDKGKYSMEDRVKMFRPVVREAWAEDE